MAAGGIGTASFEQAALARNDRYLREFVEALNLCPFARRCREEGRLVRRVVLEEDALAGAVRAAVEIDLLREEQCEVALLLFPRFADGAGAFQSLCAETRRHLRNFHCVAFHPDLPADVSDENRAVQFLRRAPDPTLQLVRIATLDRVRAGRSGGSVYLDPAALGHGPADLSLSLSEEIARANLRTLRQRGPEEMNRFLRELRRPER